MSTFNIRALEFNDPTNLWNAKMIASALDYMADTGLNALVLNDVAMLERMVYPGRLFGSTENETNVHARYSRAFRQLYRYAPRGRSRRYKDVEFVRWVIRRASERGIMVYLSNKEVFFPDVLLELHPEVQVNAVVCPTHPYWPEFLEIKYTELFEDLPGLTGLITSPATGESRVSISGNRCTCERCAKTDPADWYQSIIMSIYRPTSAAGKELVVRDFVFDRKTQDDLANAWARLPKDIVVCLKNTPHDYYPTFPHNPRITPDQDRAQWVEFDSMGQYYGWGIAPAVLIDDTRDRMSFAESCDVVGVLSRTDWEALHGHSCFDTPNLVNLYAFAQIALDLDAPERDMYAAWLRDAGALPADASDDLVDRCTQWLAQTLGRSWPVVAGSLYAHGCVFSDSSTFPVSVEHAFWLGEEKNSLRDWDPAEWDALAPAAHNVRSLLAEKDRALALFAEIDTAVRAGNPGLEDWFYRDLLHRIEIFGLYVTGFRHAMYNAAIARHIMTAGDAADPDLVAILPEAQREMREYCDRLETHEDGDWYPAFIVMSGQRLRTLHDDVEKLVAGRLQDLARQTCQ